MVAAPLAEREAGGRRVGKNVAADGLLRVSDEHGGATGVRDDLVGDVDGDAELLSELDELVHHLAELLLALGQLAAPGEVGVEERGDRVDDDERVRLLGHLGGDARDQVGLVLVREGARDEDVVERNLGVHAEALRDRLDAVGAEGGLRVDVDRLAVAAALLGRELARDAQRVAELRLARAELAERFGDRVRLEPAAEETVELGRPGRDLEHVLLAVLERLLAGLEAAADKLLGALDNLVDLRLGEALDVEEILAGLHVDAKNGVDAGVLEFLDVGGADSSFNKTFDGRFVVGGRSSISGFIVSNTTIHCVLTLVLLNLMDDGSVKSRGFHH